MVFIISHTKISTGLQDLTFCISLSGLQKQELWYLSYYIKLWRCLKAVSDISSLLEARDCWDYSSLAYSNSLNRVILYSISHRSSNLSEPFTVFYSMALSSAIYSSYFAVTSSRYCAWVLCLGTMILYTALSIHVARCCWSNSFKTKTIVCSSSNQDLFTQSWFK